MNYLDDFLCSIESDELASLYYIEFDEEYDDVF